jgi:hypothetical protein
MNATQVQGTIKSISDVIQVTQKFSKVEMVIETQDQYPQTLLVEWPNDQANAVLQFSVGDVVNVSVNIRGREWQSPSGDVKYFISLSGWRCELVSGVNPVDNQTKISESHEEEDDLPF